MTQQDFKLKPFALPAENLKITGKISRNSNVFSIDYHLSGNLATLEIPVIASLPTRQDNLWENTCFEFFIGILDTTRYWEFNLSPSKHWNIYRFDDYRQGMQPETKINSLPFNLQQSSDTLTLHLQFDLTPIISPRQSLDLAITTVIKSKNGDFSYWGLTHNSQKPDFHQRDSFIFTL